MTHDPTRPGWTCDSCGQPWPCSPARVQLGERYARDWMGLAWHMSGRLWIAAGEIPRYDPTELHERFMAWTRRRRR